MNKIVTFEAVDRNGKQIKRAAMLDENNERIIAFEYGEDETICFTKLRNKRIIMPSGRMFSITNGLKVGKELARKKYKKEKSLNR